MQYTVKMLGVRTLEGAGGKPEVKTELLDQFTVDAPDEDTGKAAARKAVVSRGRALRSLSWAPSTENQPAHLLAYVKVN